MQLQLSSKSKPETQGTNNRTNLTPRQQRHGGNSNRGRNRGNQNRNRHSSHSNGGRRRRNSSEVSSVDLSRPSTENAEAKVDTIAGSVARGHKKGNRQNANHLLNFQYEPIANSDQHRHGAGRGKHSKKHQHMPAFKTDQLVQARCQFQLSPSDYSQACLYSPDVIVDWSFVEQVFVPTENIQMCPICLDPPVAAKMTKCGHIFCTTCMLRYLDLSPNRWGRCPLCFESVYCKALKSVQFRQWGPVAAGQDTSFVMVQRKKGSLSVEVHARGHVDQLLFERMHILPDVSPIIKREYDELTAVLHGLNGQPAVTDEEDLRYFNMAFNELADRQKSWDANHNPGKPDKQDKHARSDHQQQSNKKSEDSNDGTHSKHSKPNKRPTEQSEQKREQQQPQQPLVQRAQQQQLRGAGQSHSSDLHFQHGCCCCDVQLGADRPQQQRG
mmetsp:Transcript_12681/g.24402  ORF Transcript_12681/g.24402 Transcript_12681/m.24402 type:complete len:441 (+) Transcript_12681:57-1379(+)